MSADEQARFTIQALLARGLGATEVARRTGLCRASEVWGGEVPLDRPAWYVWLAASPGAYKLELEAAAAPGPAAPAGAWHGRYTVRYYPSPLEPAFVGFSESERAAVTDGLFDGTGTPRIELAARIPAPHFVVGTLEWAAEPGGATVVALSALDRQRELDGRGDPARDVPGWRLAVPLLTSLAGVHAQIGQQALSRIVLQRQPGFEFVAAAQGLECRDTQAAVQGEALLLFASPGERAGADLLAALLDPEAECLADEAFRGRCRHPASLLADPRLALPVSHVWFGGEAHAEDRIACAC